MKKYYLIITILFCSTLTYAQLDDDRKSASNSKTNLSSNKKTQWGAYVGAGMNMMFFIKGSAGFDFVSSVSRNYALGAFAGYQTLASASAGINMLIGDYKTRKAFLLGFGSNFNGDRFFVLSRLGIRSFQSKFYTFYEIGIGDGGGGAIMSLNLGYNF